MGQDEILIDEEVFEQSTMGDPRLGKMIVEAFLKASPGLFDQCLAARDQGDLKEARRAIHTVKGSAMTLGLNPLAAACRKVEAALEDGVGDVDGLAAEAREAYAAARAMLVERFQL